MKHVYNDDMSWQKGRGYNMGFLIKWTPYHYDEDARDNIIKSYSDSHYEYFQEDQESEFLYRCGQLEDVDWHKPYGHYYGMDCYCDGIEVETYKCKLENYIR